MGVVRLGNGHWRTPTDAEHAKMHAVPKKTASRAPNFCPGLETLARALYEQAEGEGLVPAIKGRGRGRPPRDFKLAGWVTTMVARVGEDKTAELLEDMSPGQPGDKGHRDGDVPPEARRKRVRAYLQFDEEHRAKMLRPDAADEVYRLPEERLARLERLIEHYISLAYEQWLHVEKTLND
jgi:hypothetical protein